MIAVAYQPWTVALSYAIASLAAYVALDLAKRVRTTDRSVARGWWIGGSLTMGTGIWSMHFIGMQALVLPFAVGYDTLITALSWVAAVAVSAIALHVATAELLSTRRLLVGAGTMGIGICAMHYTGMAALDLVPGIRWDLPRVVASALVAFAASAVSLLIFFGLRRVRAGGSRRWQMLSALVMGAGIAGMHYTGMSAAGFEEGTVCLSTDGLGGTGMNVLVALASLVLLMLTMLLSALDVRLQRRSAHLTQSLRDANAQLEQLAFRDALTGLPNRHAFDEHVAQVTEHAERDASSLAVLFVDLDGFKPINDSFGHGQGDAVLRELADRLRARAHTHDYVARIGGDQFLVLVPDRPDLAMAAQKAQGIIDTIAEPVRNNGRELRLSCSVGIAMYPENGPGARLISRAESAMAAAKRSGGASFAFFESYMDADVREQLELQRELRVALERGTQLELFFQPKLRASDGGVSGVEALVRWRHPVRGLMSPGVFVPIAERFGLIGILGSWVIDEACRQMRVWLDSGLGVPVAINLSVHQLRQDDLVARVSTALARHDLTPQLLTCELTESAALEDGESALKAFERLGRIGVKLSIDDFGTGYSSLSYLRRLRAGQLKLDQSFVQDIESSSEARAIVAAVMQLAHALGLSVVAEGVETSGQRDLLQELGCDELQGYLFARPMAAEALAQWMRSWGGWDAPASSARSGAVAAKAPVSVQR